MTKLTKTSDTQNQKSARKRRTFDFSPSLKDGKTINYQQIIQINYFSKKKKVNSALTELTQINKPFHQLIKKGGML